MYQKQPLSSPRSAIVLRKPRDHRIDALRGIALLMMLADHVPPDFLNHFTLRNFGFADAADIFVLLAGYASWLAYGRAISRPGDRGGWRFGVARVIRRCWRLYVFQMLILATYVFVVRAWRIWQPVPVDFLEPELAHGLTWIRYVATLAALPNNLNILPLYIVLLLAFPALYWIMLRSRWLLLLLSFALWLSVQFYPSVNFPNWLDPDGWYFNPLAWQFIFAVGAVSAAYAADHGGSFRAGKLICALSWAYLIFAVLSCRHLAAFIPSSLQSLSVSPLLDKSNLGAFRWIQALAILILVQSSHVAIRLAESALGQFFALFGRHSLEIFSLGTVLDLIGSLTMSSFGTRWPVQIGVNTLGLGCIYLFARWLDHHRRQAAYLAGESRAESKIHT